MVTAFSWHLEDTASCSAFLLSHVLGRVPEHLAVLKLVSHSQILTRNPIVNLRDLLSKIFFILKFFGKYTFQQILCWEKYLPSKKIMT